MTPPDSQKLEKLIHRTLRSLPDRRAPHSLENRVLAALASRAALPWWKKSFLQWPLAAKIGFVVLTAALVRLAVFVLVFVTGGQEAAQFTKVLSDQFGWVARVWSIAADLGDFVSLIIGAIPPIWFYGGLAMLCAGYAMLFGLGAAAYRALHVQR